MIDPRFDRWRPKNLPGIPPAIVLDTHAWVQVHTSMLPVVFGIGVAFVAIYRYLHHEDPADAKLVLLDDSTFVDAFGELPNYVEYNPFALIDTQLSKVNASRMAVRAWADCFGQLSSDEQARVCSSTHPFAHKCAAVATLTGTDMEDAISAVLVVYALPLKVTPWSRAEHCSIVTDIIADAC